jgi:hypothetical protein
MPEILRQAAALASLAALLLAGCDASRAPQQTEAPAKPQAIAPGETLSDLVRNALTEIAQDPDSYSRARRFGALLPTLGPELVPAVQATLENPRFDLTAMDVDLLVRYWATHQPAEAASWAALESSPTFRGAALSTALIEWTKRDPEAAVAVAWPWAEEFTALSADIHRSVVRGWFAKGDPPELRAFMQGLGIGIPRQRTLAAYAREVIKARGVESMLAWADSLPDEDPDYKLDVYRQTIGLLERFDPEAARRWCDAHCDGPYGKNVRTILAGRWALRDPRAAFGWLAQAPANWERDAALRIVFGEWQGRDRAGALAFMAEHTQAGPKGALESWVEALVPVYALTLSEVSPAEAVAWAERITLVKEREWALIQIARTWRRLDEAAAESWLASSPLSEEAREKARSPGPKVRVSRPAAEG